jgi:predicted glutamine amidotransferase
MSRNAVHPCGVCGEALHVEKDPGKYYRAVIVASEQITADEEWTEIPDGSLFHIDHKIGLDIVLL